MNDLEEDAAIEAAGRLVEAVRPIFAGQSSPAVGAALAELLAIWLASHLIAGDDAATENMRDDLLAAHIAAVREMLPISDHELRERFGFPPPRGDA